MERLKDKIAIVTGSSSGIGKATAELFAKEGATVVVVARRKDRLDELVATIVKNGGKAFAITANLTVKEECEKVVEQTIKEFGRIDVLVNNAGIVDKHTPAIRVTDQLWKDVVDINQTSVFYMCRAALKHMAQADYGSIVNVASVAAVNASGGFSYSATKYAVVGMTKNIAMQYGGTGIRCNVICPGPTPTELNTPDKLATFDKEFTEICGRHNDHTVGESDVTDQANAILFFANDESKCVTGQVLAIDRGFCL